MHGGGGSLCDSTTSSRDSRKSLPGTQSVTQSFSLLFFRPTRTLILSFQKNMSSTMTTANHHRHPHIRRAIKIGGSLAGASIGSIIGYGFYLYETDEGTKRMIKAYSTFVPVVLHYRWMEFRHKFEGLGIVTDREWEELDLQYAKPTVDKLAELQGMYCKYGQTAAGFTNTFGDAWIEQLRKLENEVPPRPVDVVYKTIQEETGKPVNEVFESFDPVPLGSASIGQVHKARLKSGGREVAVKIQYPEAQELFQNDMHTIRTFCEALAPEHVVILGALERQNATELDYTNEAKNLEMITHNMQNDNFMPREVIVPKPLKNLTTKRMLVMELLPGPKLIDGINAYFEIWAEQHGTTLHALEQQLRDEIDREGIPSKYDGPNAFQISSYRRYLKARDAVVNLGIAVHNSTIGKIIPRLQIEKYQQSTLPPNIPRIIDTLMRVHGYQLLKDGLFNADPHGGNFLLLPDGRIGLIDYGSTKQLTKKERLSCCIFFAALARNDAKMLFDLCEIGGYKSKYGRKDVLLKLLQFGYDSYGRDVTEGKNIQQFIDHLKEQDPWEEVPDNFVMAQFMSIRLRSLALGMNHPVKCSDWWGPIAEEILKEEGHPYESWDYNKLTKFKPDLNMQSYKFA